MSAVQEGSKCMVLIASEKLAYAFKISSLPVYGKSSEPAEAPRKKAAAVPLSLSYTGTDSYFYLEW